MINKQTNKSHLNSKWKWKSKSDDVLAKLTHAPNKANPIGTNINSANGSLASIGKRALPQLIIRHAPRAIMLINIIVNRSDFILIMIIVNPCSLLSTKKKATNGIRHNQNKWLFAFFSNRATPIP